MNARRNRRVRPALFTLGGALLGVAVYLLAGFAAARGAVTTLALAGWLLSGIV